MVIRNIFDCDKKIALKYDTLVYGLMSRSITSGRKIHFTCVCYNASTPALCEPKLSAIKSTCLEVPFFYFMKKNILEPPFSKIATTKHYFGGIYGIR